ncbi:TOMM precursor leader peptide-binding protein [Natrialba sp. PRR66]|uniref:TOMM precursor leader peptide-binding protein n=1 Tax=Natrialba sp. PRR66 TaxID=3098146 RepID=UPI002B1DD4DD|nr:TOMM precursor leader peptide-binding protein [Natrialba sp. PRR66]
MSDNIISPIGRLEKPKLNPSFIAIQADQDTYHIRAGPWTGPVLTIKETDEEDAIEDLFELLDGEHTLEEIFAAFDEEDHAAIGSLLEQLADRNIIYDGAEISTNLGGPQLMHSSRFQHESRTPLGETDALVINAGSIAVQIAQDLLESGVGTVRFAQPIPEAKADVSDFRSDGRFELVAEGDFTDAIADTTAAIYAADRAYPALGEEISKTADETGTPWMLAQVSGFDGLVGPTVFPGETGCYNCLQRRTAANINDVTYDMYRDTLSDQPGLSTEGLPSYSRMVAGYSTIDFLHLLAYGQSFTIGRSLVINFLDLSVEVNDVLRLPRCDICGKDPGDDMPRFINIRDRVKAGELGQISKEE